MKTQIIKDIIGKPSGVFIPIEDWENIKKTYPNKFKSIEHLFEALDREECSIK